jgi:hypothetical protein
MTQQFVRVLADVHCDCAVDQRPIYRLYVNDELFTERTWIWENCYLEENFQISAPAGIYPIRFEIVDVEHGRIKVRNHRVITGPGRIVDYQGQTAVEISNESK